MNLGEDAIFVRLPPRIIAGEEPIEEWVGCEPIDGVADRWRISPGPETPPEMVMMMKGWWEHAAGGGLKIVWTNGFSGVDVLLAWADGRWRGQATTFWDFGRPKQSAPVELQRTPCW